MCSINIPNSIAHNSIHNQFICTLTTCYTGNLQSLNAYDALVATEPAVAQLSGWVLAQANYLWPQNIFGLTVEMIATKILSFLLSSKTAACRTELHWKYNYENVLWLQTAICFNYTSLCSCARINSYTVFVLK